jgi:lysophospholipase L1-like esterase
MIKRSGTRGQVTAAPDEKIRVACVGDSITFGAGIKDRRRNAYPVQLGRLLGANDWEVRNFGVSARTMLKKGDHPIWKEKAYAAAKEFKPHVVIIKLGTNDSKPHNWKHKDEFAADTAAMVEDFRSLESKPVIFLCRPVPAFPARWGITDKVITEEVIPLIDKVAKEKETELIDLYKALKGQDKLFPDKIHPNAKGAAVMAKTIAAALKSTIKR